MLLNVLVPCILKKKKNAILMVKHCGKNIVVISLNNTVVDLMEHFM